MKWLPFAVQKVLLYSYRKAMMKMLGCLFCQIASGEKPAKLVYEDEQCVAFLDIHPKAPVHVLVIPRKHISSLNGVEPADEPLLGHLLAVAGRIAGEKEIDGSGYRTVINTNAEAGQSVFHLHVHLLGGRRLGWPPG